MIKPHQAQPDAPQRQSEGPQETSGRDKDKGKDKGLEFEL